MSASAKCYEDALAAEASAWDEMRNHFLDDMTQSYENSGDVTLRIMACVRMQRFADSLYARVCDVSNAERRLIDEKRAAKESKP